MSDSKGLSSRWRAEFPALKQRIHGHSLRYLDSAATTLTPQSVIDAVTRCYTEGYANPHRGAHSLSERATSAYEGARGSVQRWLGAQHRDEIVFTGGCTESIHLVASAWGEHCLRSGDEVVVSALEHHSNWLPWQQLCASRGARLRVVPMDSAGQLDQSAYVSLLNSRTRLVALTHISNVLGVINPVEQMTQLAHQVGAVVLIDGAQAVGHQPVDVQKIGCEFYAFSAHKMYGPYGIGGLYARRPWLTSLPVWRTGGGMVQQVAADRSTFAPPPAKFEAGTPNVAGACGLAAAIELLERVGWGFIQKQEADVLACAEHALDSLKGLRRLGGEGERSSVISFVVEGVHPHDLSTVLDHEGIAVRAGHHCAQPTMRGLGVTGTVRLSLGLYSTEQEINSLLLGLDKGLALLAL